MNEREGSAERARARLTWPIRKFALGEEPEDLSERTTPEERIAMMWPLALEAWRVAGLRIPDYARHEAPIQRLEGYEK